MKYQRRMSLDPYYHLRDTVREYTVDQANKLGFGGTLPNPGVLNDNGSDNGNPDFDVVPENNCMDWGERHDNYDSHVEIDEDIHHEFPNSQTSLGDLCLSHMDAFLANIAETEWQTGIAVRVSKWKQGIEQDLEEQDSHPQFDIHDYGERIMEKLSLEASNSTFIPFSDLVKEQEKYDVASSFYALLQLANNEDVYLERRGVHGESVCYTTENTFHVRLLNHGKKRRGNMDQQSRHQKQIAGPP
ncbi:hypothetical protein L6164_025420 [Bauhinia variegata]|uniref:Uncharacterized protein n=1 Tax=Bauhinia variegata TaxID=167791 RepID=A0ACB9M0U9_BAUVA|nr:hypothetical protein L6164_025420 [Bauhinia variegata]